MKKDERKTILVIEDEPEVCNFASRVLELEGYNVLQAEDGDNGLRLVRQNDCALVLLDLWLPGRDGWAVLEEMKADPELCTIPVVVFTASAAIPQHQRALSMGAADYLIKPVSAVSLSKTVARVLNRTKVVLTCHQRKRLS